MHTCCALCRCQATAVCVTYLILYAASHVQFLFLFFSKFEVVVPKSDLFRDFMKLWRCINILGLEVNWMLFVKNFTIYLRH